MNAARGGRDDVERLDERQVFSELLEDSVDDLYENAPCGYLSTLLDGQIAKVNTTLLSWLGYERSELVGRRHFSELLTVGGQIYHETHLRRPRTPRLRNRLRRVNSTLQATLLPPIPSQRARPGDRRALPRRLPRRSRRRLL
jgi:PAS domain-containing protein